MYDDLARTLCGQTMPELIGMSAWGTVGALEKKHKSAIFLYGQTLLFIVLA